MTRSRNLKYPRTKFGSPEYRAKLSEINRARWAKKSRKQRREQALLMNAAQPHANRLVRLAKMRERLAEIRAQEQAAQEVISKS